MAPTKPHKTIKTYSKRHCQSDHSRRRGSALTSTQSSGIIKRNTKTFASVIFTPHSRARSEDVESGDLNAGRPRRPTRKRPQHGKKKRQRVEKNSIDRRPRNSQLLLPTNDDVNLEILPRVYGELFPLVDGPGHHQEDGTSSLRRGRSRFQNVFSRTLHDLRGSTQRLHSRRRTQVHSVESWQGRDGFTRNETRVASKPSPLVSFKRHKSYRRTPPKDKIQQRLCLDVVEGPLPEVVFVRHWKRPTVLHVAKGQTANPTALGKGQGEHNPHNGSRKEASFHLPELHQRDMIQQRGSKELLHASGLSRPSASLQDVPASHDEGSFEPTIDRNAARISNSPLSKYNVGVPPAARKPWHPPLQVQTSSSPFNSNDWENTILRQSFPHHNPCCGSSGISQATIEVFNSPTLAPRRSALANISPNSRVSQRLRGERDAQSLSPVNNSYPLVASNNDLRHKSPWTSTSLDKQRVMSSNNQGSFHHKIHCARSDPPKLTASTLFVPQSMDPTFSSARQIYPLPSHHQHQPRTLRILHAPRRPRLLIAEPSR